MKVDVVDTDPEPDDINLKVVEGCNNVLEALQSNFPEYASLVTDVLPNVRSLAACCAQSDHEVFVQLAVAIKRVECSFSA